MAKGDSLVSGHVHPGLRPFGFFNKITGASSGEGNPDLSSIIQTDRR